MWPTPQPGGRSQHIPAESGIVARLLQAILAGLLLPWFAYRLGRRFFNMATGLAAAGLMVFYSYFIYHNAALMTESLYIIAILWAFDLAYTMAESKSCSYWWLLGLVMAVAVLLRQVYLFFIPVLLLWLAWTGRDKLLCRRLVLSAVLVALCVIPWTIRNYLHYHQFLLLNKSKNHQL